MDESIFDKKLVDLNSLPLRAHNALPEVDGVESGLGDQTHPWRLVDSAELTLRGLASAINNLAAYFDDPSLKGSQENALNCLPTGAARYLGDYSDLSASLRQALNGENQMTVAELIDRVEKLDDRGLEILLPAANAFALHEGEHQEVA